MRTHYNTIPSDLEYLVEKYGREIVRDHGLPGRADVIEIAVFGAAEAEGIL